MGVYLIDCSKTRYGLFSKLKRLIFTLDIEITTSGNMDQLVVLVVMKPLLVSHIINDMT